MKYALTDGERETCIRRAPNIFGTHIRHDCTLNESTLSIQASFADFGRRDMPQYIDRRKLIKSGTYARPSESVCYILDVQGMTRVCLSRI